MTQDTFCLNFQKFRKKYKHLVAKAIHVTFKTSPRCISSLVNFFAFLALALNFE